jgi:hypothetical protein
MADLTAIDILINPDDDTVERARAVNARLRQSVPGGFALDASHQPHITTLQRYVRTADLDQVFGAVAKIIAATDIATLTFEAEMIRHVDWGIPGQGYAVFVVKPGPGVLDYQARLLSAVTPFAESGGTAAAFVTGADGINDTTLKWVEEFVPGQIGARYVPHLSLGFATLDDLKVIESEPFAPFPIHPASIAVYHLGNNGNARTELKSWKL